MSAMQIFLKYKVRFVISFLLFFLGCSAACFGFERYNSVTKYDSYFKKYTRHYFGPGFDWRYFKSQAIAESNLDSDAKSHVGAKGVMQIMPKTFEEIKYKNPSIKGNTQQPKWNIAAGIYYDRAIWKLFKAKRPFMDRLGFMFGAYNAGKGNIIKAQKIAKKSDMNPNIWSSIEKSLGRVTGKHSKETIGYVDKINKIKGVLK